MLLYTCCILVIEQKEGGKKKIQDFENNKNDVKIRTIESRIILFG